jgi:glycolate oxidase iron-sulfur subunit
VSVLEELTDAITRCNKCGFCQAGCPTYKVSGLEWTVARGRLALIRDVIEGKLPLDEAMKEPLFNCLTCNGCKAQCPPAVDTASLVLKAREELVRQHGLPVIEKLIFGQLLGRPELLNYGALLAQSAQAAKLIDIGQTMADKMGLPKVLGPVLGPLMKDHHLMPKIAHHPTREVLKKNWSPVTAPKYRVAYFIGCASNLIYPQVGRALARVLRREQVEMVFPDHYCCGAPPLVYGDAESARNYAKENLDRFLGLGVDAIVTDCATCGSFLKEYPELLAGEKRYEDKAKKFAGKVKDISQFLTEIDYKPQGRNVNLKASYHEPCHLGRYQGLAKPPRALLSGVPGLKYTEMTESDMCCGGAGSYCFTHYDLSAKILERKMNNFADTGSEVLVTSCPACMMQLERGFKDRKLPGRVMHLVEVLDAGNGR